MVFSRLNDDAHKLQASPCKPHSGQGRQRDTFAVSKWYCLQRTPFPTCFHQCKAGNPVGYWACRKKLFLLFRRRFMFQDTQKLCGYFCLTTSSLNPPLLVSGSMLQSACNLEIFGFIYMDGYAYKWICLILFPSYMKIFQNLQQVSSLLEVALCPLSTYRKTSLNLKVSFCSVSLC